VSKDELRRRALLIRAFMVRRALAASRFLIRNLQGAERFYSLSERTFDDGQVRGA